MVLFIIDYGGSDWRGSAYYSFRIAVGRELLVAAEGKTTSVGVVGHHPGKRCNQSFCRHSKE